MMAAMVDPVNDASHPPQALFAAGIVQGSYLHQFAVTGDGKRFLLRVPLEREAPVPITVVQNWPALLRK